MQTIAEARYYCDVKRIADNLSKIAQGMQELVQLMNTTCNNSENKENGNGSND